MKYIYTATFTPNEDETLYCLMLTMQGKAYWQKLSAVFTAKDNSKITYNFHFFAGYYIKLFNKTQAFID